MSGAKLIVQAPDQPVAEFTLSDQPMVVGRDAACDIPINSKFVSRRQARVEPHGSGFRLLVEPASRNPLFVNGEQVRESHLLVPGDMIRVADVTMEFQQSEMDPLATHVFVSPPALGVTREVKPEISQSERDRVTELFGLRGTLSIMFTDVEGSTNLTTTLGDLRAQEYMRTHNAILRGEFEAHNGYEVKGQGDGFMVVFTSARQALRCAVAIQRSLAAYNTEHPDLPIRVRIGLNVGEVISEEDDFFGTAVILAARVANRGSGGDILISQLMHQIVAPTGEFRFKQRGTVHLKGFQRPQRVYEVGWQDEQEDEAHESQVQCPE
jgi:class 3 adenylate cyclase